MQRMQTALALAAVFLCLTSAVGTLSAAHERRVAADISHAVADETESPSRSNPAVAVDIAYPGSRAAPIRHINSDTLEGRLLIERINEAKFYPGRQPATSYMLTLHTAHEGDVKVLFGTTSGWVFDPANKRIAYVGRPLEKVLTREWGMRQSLH